MYEALEDATWAEVSASELPTLSSGLGKVDTPREYVYQNSPRMTEINQGDTNAYEQPDADNNEERCDDTHVKVLYTSRGHLARNFTTSTFCTMIEAKNECHGNRYIK